MNGLTLVGYLKKDISESPDCYDDEKHQEKTNNNTKTYDDG
jgi:hypothetical protein